MMLYSECSMSFPSPSISMRAMASTTPSRSRRACKSARSTIVGRRVSCGSSE
jgi:hypothetical protein